MNLLLHGDGDSHRGLGHLVRALGIAQELTRIHNVTARYQIRFATRNALQAHTVSKDLQSFTGVGVEIIDLGSKNDHELATSLSELKPDVLISDGKYEWTSEDFAKLKSTIDKLIVIDAMAEAKTAADYVVYPTDHARPEYTATVPPLKLRTGIEWTWLHPSAKRFVGATGEKPRPKYDLLITAGGADPYKLTLEAMDCAEKSPFFNSGVVVIGSAFAHKNEVLNRVTVSKKHWTSVAGGPAAHAAMAESHAAICAFGISAYECYAMKTPQWIVTHDAGAKHDVTEFLRKHPDAGIWTDLKTALDQSTLPTPTPDTRIGQLSQNIATLI